MARRGITDCIDGEAAANKARLARLGLFGRARDFHEPELDDNRREPRRRPDVAHLTGREGVKEFLAAELSSGVS